uniref:Ribosomal protein S7 n=1 Tax=Pleurosigma inscriptura TaxID=2819025 RepID=A0A8A3SMF9_9STRA|nr:ribosomal protein S7 [Pleurosigma inscriptura]QSZ78236.1 ribosomal protein S7 [Pleurosigma inscriptura]
MKNGNKKTCEKILLKSFKGIQKSSLKSYKKILKIGLINSASVFRITELKQKKRKKKSSVKEIPTFILNNFERISWSLKSILIYSKKQNANNFYKKLKQEIIINSKNKGNAVDKKTDLHKQILPKKRLLLYFRW